MFLFSVIPRVSSGAHHTPSLAYLHCSFFLKKMHVLLEIQRIPQSRHQADIFFEESVSIKIFTILYGIYMLSLAALIKIHKNTYIVRDARYFCGIMQSTKRD